MFLRPVLPLAATIALLTLAGCAGGISPVGLFTAVLAFVLVACSDTDGVDPLGSSPDATVADGTVDGSPDLGPPFGDGYWENCCRDGQVSMCWCSIPQGSCNYGWYDDCGNGTCAVFDGCPEDAGVPDSGEDGTWEPCCVDGRITTCFCPADALCNYGWYEDCGNETCTFIGETCP